jgi:hypothetical protein
MGRAHGRPVSPESADVEVDGERTHGTIGAGGLRDPKRIMKGETILAVARDAEGL